MPALIPALVGVGVVQVGDGDWRLGYGVRGKSLQTFRLRDQRQIRPLGLSSVSYCSGGLIGEPADIKRAFQQTTVKI